MKKTLQNFADNISIEEMIKQVFLTGLKDVFIIAIYNGVHYKLIAQDGRTRYSWVNISRGLHADLNVCIYINIEDPIKKLFHMGANLYLFKDFNEYLENVKTIA